MKLPIRFALQMAALLSLAAGTATAQTINWGNAPTLSDINFDSDGNLLDDTYTFMFGVFDSTFDPCVEDHEDWFSNWTTLDSVGPGSPDGDLYNEPLSFFSSTWFVTDNTYANQQAYIWVANQTSPVDETTEWALISDASWTIPEFTEDHPTPEEWRVAGATELKFGGLNDVQGDGEFDTDPGTFEIQTHTFPPPVPEPGTFAFFGFASALAFRRRRGGRKA